METNNYENYSWEFLPLKSDVEIQEENVLFSVKSVLSVLNLDEMYQLNKLFNVTNSSPAPKYGDRELHVKCSKGNITRLIEFIKTVSLLEEDQELIGYNTRDIVSLDQNLSVSIKKKDDNLRICYSKLGVKPDFTSQTLIKGLEF